MTDPTIWTTSHIINEKVCSALHKGTAWIRKDVSLYNNPHPSAVHGILRGCGRIINDCIRSNIDFYHIDNGYMKAGHFDGYYRVTKNGLQATYDENKTYSDARFNKLGIRIPPYKKNGRHILVCPPSEAMCNFFGDVARTWNAKTVDELVKRTDRPIRARTKRSTTSLEDDLCDAHCVVTFNSNVAINGLLSGVPVIASKYSVVNRWNKLNLEDIESNQRLYDAGKHKFFHWLAHQQWTLEEIEKGSWRQ